MAAQCPSEDLNDVEQANLREMTRQYQQAALLPESLVEAKALAGSNANMPGALSVRRMTGPGSAPI
jgi:Zn-dependent M32 family carboxypeptidase